MNSTIHIERNRIMKGSIVALGLAVFALAVLAEDQHRNNVLKAEQHSVARQPLADAEEWLRSRPAGKQDGTGDSKASNVEAG
jgi:hypothetical protein